MVGMKITRQRIKKHENNSPKGWTVQNNLPKGWPDGELNGRHKNNSPKGGESNRKHENNSPKGWTVQK